MLARNDNYWGPNKPVFPKRHLLQVQGLVVAAAAAAGGRRRHRHADLVRLGRPAGGRLQRRHVEIVDSFNYVYIALSPGAVGGENLQDVNVRKAIGMAIDYDGAIEALVAGNGKKQASPIPNGFLGSADLTLPEYDLDGAKAALEPAGLGDGFELDATYPEANVYGVDFSLMMQKIQQDLAKVNVELELTPVQFPEWVDKINARASRSPPCTSRPTTPTRASTCSTSVMIPGSSWAITGGRRRRRDAASTTRRSPSCSPRHWRRRATPRHEAYTASRPGDDRRRHHHPDRQPAARAGHSGRHHRHALQRLLQPRPRSARRLAG